MDRDRGGGGGGGGFERCAWEGGRRVEGGGFERCWRKEEGDEVEVVDLRDVHGREGEGWEEVDLRDVEEGGTGEGGGFERCAWEGG
ncbi:hypothetical protein Pcinc_040848 [Petrolisthes cinctipes]|uniref:Uncharacterized protein n=1 Tax=Petrolisthes cinctipes TaxID=88211 RepID=A0AAE1EJ19_PETCI|nr:hypothetical protein Pcinc_040848 [Petrolisthes cinctipes]